MPTRTDESQRVQHDRDRRAASRHPDEPRHFDVSSHEPATDDGHDVHAGFDDKLNPIDDEDINTHGSER